MQLLDLFRPLTDFGLTNRQETDDSHWWWCREIKCIELSILGKKSIDSILLLLLLFCTLSCMHLFLINSHQCSGMARCLLRFTVPPEAADCILTISSRVRSRSSNNRHYKQCRFCFVLGLCCCCFLCRNPKSNWPRYWKCNHDRWEPLHSYHNSTYPNWRTATRQWVFAFLLHSLSRCMAWQNGRRVVFCVLQMSHLMRH